MSKLIIRCILSGVLGWYLADIGWTFVTWQFWVCLIPFNFVTNILIPDFEKENKNNETH